MLVAFGKPAAMVLWALVMAMVWGAWNLVGADPRSFKDLGVFIAMVSVLAALAIFLAIARWADVDHEILPWKDTSQRRAIKLVGSGYAVAFVLSLTLGIYNCEGTRMEARSQQSAQEQRESNGRLSSNPDIQKGLEMARQIQARREQAATRKAATRIAATQQR